MVGPSLLPFANLVSEELALLENLNFRRLHPRWRQYEDLLPGLRNDPVVWGTQAKTKFR